MFLTCPYIDQAFTSTTLLRLARNVTHRSMHYERAPRFRRWKLDVAPPPLRCAVQGLRSATAALGEGTRVVCPAKKLQQGLGKLAGEWHFTLGGKQALARMTFPPRRQLK